jgi:hypothetical protein
MYVCNRQSNRCLRSQPWTNWTILGIVRITELHRISDIHAFITFFNPILAIIGFWYRIYTNNILINISEI